MVILICLFSPSSAWGDQGYQEIWLDNESPLRKITRGQAAKLQQLFDKTYADTETIPQAHYAMTYSGPSLASKVEELEQTGFEHISVATLSAIFSHHYRYLRPNSSY